MARSAGKVNHTSVLDAAETASGLPGRSQARMICGACAWTASGPARGASGSPTASASNHRAGARPQRVERRMPSGDDAVILSPCLVWAVGPRERGTSPEKRASLGVHRTGDGAGLWRNAIDDTTRNESVKSPGSCGFRLCTTGSVRLRPSAPVLTAGLRSLLTRTLATWGRQPLGPGHLAVRRGRGVVYCPWPHMPGVADASTVGVAP